MQPRAEGEPESDPAARHRLEDPARMGLEMTASRAAQKYRPQAPSENTP